MLSFSFVDMERAKCSFCHRTFDDATLLSLHHEYESCFNSNVSASSASNEGLICPICDKLFPDPMVLQIHVNEDHDQNPVHTTTTTTTSDQLFAQELERRERMKVQYAQEHTASVVSYEDLPEDADAQIARLLQEEENAQSFQEFQVGTLAECRIIFRRYLCF